MHEHVGALDELPRRPRLAHVAAQLLDGSLQLGLVERRDVERPHVVPVGEQPTRQV
jgi:hypothetical protein